MKHRLVLILLFLVLLGAVAFFYIDNIFLPVQFKRFLTTKAETFLQREVTVGSIDFRFLRGFILENITVARKDDPNRPFLQIKEVSFNLLLAPIFRKQAIILPHIKIKDPYIYIARDEQRVWNFADLPHLGRSVKRKNTFSVLLRALTIEGGRIDYTDEALAEPFFESIKGIYLDTTLSLNKGIRFIAQATVPARKTRVRVKGNFTLLTKKLTAQAILENVHLARYLPLAASSQPYIHLADGVISSADLSVTYSGQELHVQSAFAVDGMDMMIGEGRNIKGTLHVPDAHLRWRDKKWDAKGRLHIAALEASSSDGQEFSGNLAADLNLLTIFSNNITSQGDVAIEDASLTLAGGQRFSGNITAVNASVVKGDGKVLLQGNFDIDKAAAAFGEQSTFEGDLSTQGTRLEWSRNENGAFAVTAQTALSVNGAEISLEGDRSMRGNIIFSEAGLRYTPDEMTWKSIGQLRAADIHLPESHHFQGSPHFNFSGSYNPEKRPSLDYTGTLRLTDSLLTGITRVGPVSGIEGTLTVTPDRAQTDRLALTAQETRFEISGILTDFNKPRANITAGSKNIRIEKILEFFPAIRETFSSDITGAAAARASYNGFIHSPAAAVITATARLSEATVMHERLPQLITGVSGRLDYEKDLLKWHRLRGTYLDETYTLNGELNNFSRPTIDTTVTSEKLKLTTQIKLLRSAFQLKSFTGKYLHSTFDLKGDVILFEEDDADVDLRGVATLDLDDAAFIFPRFKGLIEKLSPVSGILSMQGIYRGKLHDWRSWQLAFNGKSEKLTIKGYPFEKVAARFTQRDLAVSRCNVTSKIYGGDLSVVSSADLRGPKIPFSVTIDLKNMDFAKYRLDKNPKNRQLAGNLLLNAALQGDAKKWREMTGKGSVSIANGYLWQWNILSGMSRALLIPEFNNFVFTDARGNFEARDGKIVTHNAQMTGQSVTLKGKGWIDFETNLNFDITPIFSKLAIQRSSSLKKKTTSLITQTEGYLNIRLTGTLAKPRHRLEKFPMKILEGTIGNTTGTLREMFDGIVEEIF